MLKTMFAIVNMMRITPVEMSSKANVENQTAISKILKML